MYVKHTLTYSQAHTNMRAHTETHAPPTHTFSLGHILSQTQILTNIETEPYTDTLTIQFTDTQLTLEMRHFEIEKCFRLSRR